MRRFIGNLSTNGNTWFMLALIAAVVLFAGYRFAQVRPAETPAVVSNGGLTLADAIKQSDAEGKPVLAFATAEWCGPCQRLKRTALADPGVQSLIQSRTIAVTLEDTTSQGAKDIGKLPVDGFPTLLLIKDGTVETKIVGAQPTSAVRAWLEANTTAPAVNTPADG